MVSFDTKAYYRKWVQKESRNAPTTDAVTDWARILVADRGTSIVNVVVASFLTA